MAGDEDIRVIELRGDRGVHAVARPAPEPASGQIVVAPRVVGLCATDREIRDGVMAYFANGMASYPIVPGHEWVATVQKVGPDVDGIRVGDRVVGECSIGCGVCGMCAEGRYHMCPDRHETGLIGQDGGLAEQLVFPARAAHVVPEGLSDEAAALIEPTAIAYNAIAKARLRATDRVLVVGSGPIGLLAMQVARATAGCSVHVCDLSPTRLRLAEELGADRTILLGPDEAPIEEGAWDVVIEVSGSGGGLATALRAVRSEGSVICVSLYGVPEVAVDLDRIVTHDIQLRGALGSPGIWPQVIELLESGRVRPEALITRTLAFDEVADAFDLIGDPGEVKIAVRIGRARS